MAARGARRIRRGRPRPRAGAGRRLRPGNRHRLPRRSRRRRLGRGPVATHGRHARRLHPGLRFAVASATDLDLPEASLGGVLGWWSLFNLPHDVLPEVLASFARALMPGGQALLGTHVGDGDVVRTEAYGGVPVTWTTHLWQPEELIALLASAGLELVAELRLPPAPFHRAQVLLAARRPADAGCHDSPAHRFAAGVSTAS